MFAYAMARAVELGLAEDKLVENATRAFRVGAGGVRPDGAVQGGVVPPGGHMVPLGTSPISQGWLPLLMQVLRRIEDI